MLTSDEAVEAAAKAAHESYERRACSLVPQKPFVPWSAIDEVERGQCREDAAAALAAALASQGRPGSLGAHVARKSAEVDGWPESAKPAYLKAEGSGRDDTGGPLAVLRTRMERYEASCGFDGELRADVLDAVRELLAASTQEGTRA